MYPTCVILLIDIHSFTSSLWSHWFTATADESDELVQAEAIETAEVIFKFVAESYLE